MNEETGLPQFSQGVTTDAAFIVPENGNPIIAQGDYAISIGGGQPDTGAPGITGKFHVDGQYALPE